MVPERHESYAQIDGLLPHVLQTSGDALIRNANTSMQQMTPAKRKRLLKTFGSYPAGYTHDDLERLLDLVYGMFSNIYTQAELRQIVVSDPFDRSEHPRQFKLIELADWLEALVA